MKTIRYLSTVLCASLCACGYNDFGDLPPGGRETVVPNADIAAVRAMCGPEGVYHVADSIIVAGYVTADDRSGNIYRSFFIEDGSDALEVRAGMYSLHNIYPRGRYVAVKLCGMTVSIYDGTLQAGLSVNEGGYGVGYFDNQIVANEYLFPSGEFATVIPEQLAIPQLDENYCGRLVSIGPVTFAGDHEEDATDEPGKEPVWKTVSWAVPRSAENPVPQAAYRTFRDTGGNTVQVYTSGYAAFAGNAIPDGTVAITGILSHGSAGYYLRLRDTADVVREIYN